MCKACKAECPSNVDMAKLKAEFLQFYYRDRPRPLGQRLMAQHPSSQPARAPVARRWSTGCSRNGARPLAAGEDRRHRPPPQPAAAALPTTSAAGSPAASRTHRRSARHRCCCWTTASRPSTSRTIGQAAVRVLERGRLQVELAGLTCCGRALISKGFLSQARQLVQAQAPGPGGAVARRHADPGAGAELPVDAGRRMAGAGAGTGDAAASQQPRAGRQLAGAADRRPATFACR